MRPVRFGPVKTTRARILRLAVVITAGALLIGGALLCRRDHVQRSDQKIGPAAFAAIATGAVELEKREDEMTRRYWGPELLAESCGARVEALWDSLKGAGDRLEALARWEGMPEIRLPALDRRRELPCYGVVEFGSTKSGGALLAAKDVPAWIERFRADGWLLEWCSFRHVGFSTNQLGQPDWSTLHCRGFLRNDSRKQRAILEGEVRVRWRAGDIGGDGAGWDFGTIDASRLELRVRVGSPVFPRILDTEIQPFPGSFFIDPLIALDTGRGERPLIVAAGRNLAFQLENDKATWMTNEFAVGHSGLSMTGVVADFDGDGLPDYLDARFAGVFLRRGLANGGFAAVEEPVWKAQPRLRYAQAIACGDVDGDGDVDVWLAQYKSPYEEGQMPTPYFDANDGHPSYLLLNDGKGGFTDATESAGLGPKRFRRTYSASFVDLDGDGSLDLWITSDFSGVDVWLNDGRGHFRDASASLLPDRSVFGMAHALGDFDGDGRPDCFVTGMRCPTPQRLVAMGLARPDRLMNAEAMRAMSSGNKLYLGRGERGFVESARELGAADTGWSWGCAVADLNNDSLADIAVAAGHETRESVRDYENEFWLHDIYVGSSTNDPVAQAYFGLKFARTRGRGWSYGGNEANGVLMNLGGAAFQEIGYLLGLDVFQDSRNVLLTDVDGDGAVDLVTTTFETWPHVRQTLRVYRNAAVAAGSNWIGLRTANEKGEVLPPGTKVLVRAGARVWPRWITTGDSHRAQNLSAVHVGLGTVDRVDSISILRPGKPPMEIRNPSTGRYIAWQ